MPVTTVEIRRGAYYDSIVLMELQAALTALPGIIRAGVVMGTAANKDLLARNGLLPTDAATARPDDLLISLSGEDAGAVEAALGQVDHLLARRPTAVNQTYHPRSLATAAASLPGARWVLVSVPGSYAAGVAREALHLNKHVFLYSDNVSLAEEVALKKEAAARGLLVMGPDCGTAILGGVGFGFANRVRRGPIGLVGATGTGLQHVTARIHQQGSGISHALGTGGRDLSRDVGGITARQALDVLGRDPDTRVLVLLSKPPDPAVAATLLRTARSTGKPVVVHFVGYTPPLDSTDTLHVAASLEAAATLAVELAGTKPVTTPDTSGPVPAFAPEQRYLRGLFSGGTLAYETLLSLHTYCPTIYSNLSANGSQPLPDAAVSRGHTLLDLGDDAFTRGRPHPMLDHTLRLARLAQEAADPSVAVILLDVVLGYGAHPNPAGDLGPAIAEVRTRARAAGRTLDVVVLVVGTDEDPQDRAAQIETLQHAGAHVVSSCSAAAAYIGRRLQALDRPEAGLPVDLTAFEHPVQAINVGLEAFAASLTAQEATVVHVDWRPPAGGNEKLRSILERMKNQG